MVDLKQKYIRSYCLHNCFLILPSIFGPAFMLAYLLPIDIVSKVVSGLVVEAVLSVFWLLKAENSYEKFQSRRQRVIMESHQNPVIISELSVLDMVFQEQNELNEYQLREERRTAQLQEDPPPRYQNVVPRPPHTPPPSYRAATVSSLLQNYQNQLIEQY